MWPCKCRTRHSMSNRSKIRSHLQELLESSEPCNCRPGQHLRLSTASAPWAFSVSVAISMAASWKRFAARANDLRASNATQIAHPATHRTNRTTQRSICSLRNDPIPRTAASARGSVARLIASHATPPMAVAKKTRTVPGDFSKRLNQWS
jgi:hypothetical protein